MDSLSPVTIRLCNMVIYGYHGALTEENTLGQRFEIDLEFQFEAQEAIATDQLKATVSYVEVYHLVQHSVTGRPFKLLESLGHQIIQTLRQRFGQILKLVVRIRKPSVPLPGALDHVEVELSWHQGEV